MELETILLLVAIFVLLIVIVGLCKSSFQSSTQQIKQTSADEKPIGNDSVVVVYADWCGHCKAAKPEFEKAASMSNKVVLLNSDTPAGKEYIKKNNVKGFPTIVKGNTVLNIPRKAEAIVAAAEK
jgi:thiol-disulfide isomerase/thioredoxin